MVKETRRRGQPRRSLSRGGEGQPPRARSSASSFDGDGNPGSSEHWSPHVAGISIERDPSTGQVVGLGHAGLPWIAELDSPGDDDELTALAGAYVEAVNEVLQLPASWIDDLAGDSTSDAPRAQLRWKRFKGDPRDSFRLVRRDAEGEPLDETAVVLACLAWPDGDDPQFLNGGQGLRVTMHLDPPTEERPSRVRITSITTTLPPWTEEELAAAWPWSAKASAAVQGEQPTFQTQRLGVALEMLRVFMCQLFGFPTSWAMPDLGFRYVTPEGAVAPRPDYIDIVAKATSPHADDPLSYALAMQWRTGVTYTPQVRGRIPLATHASPPPPQVPVFVVDPVTRSGNAVFEQTRPYRSSADLDPQRDPATLLGVTPGGGAGRFLLTDGVNVDVVTSYIAGDAPPIATKEIDTGVAYASRSNTQAAVNTYFHFKELFHRLARYGFVIADYFAYAVRPLTLRYRGGIVPGGRDGSTVNAQVRWQLRPDAPTAAGVGILTTDLALADLRLSPGRSPLGIACDPRWLWHEFGHVLLAAATGELEFRFAHSAGDGMGAIVHDPDSLLAGDPVWRGISFPWVSLPERFHDRRPQDGWSWSGTFNGRERDFAVNVSDRRGYWTEQLLSSSLFRMYRALGGDAMVRVGPVQVVIDRVKRRDAADFAIFLVVKAMRLLGPASVAPALTADAFVRALIDADIGTSTLAAQPGMGTHPRQGGLSQKVVRWAFEQQGLYPDLASPPPHDAPGLPPSVDVYIDSGPMKRRRGEYEPVTFVDGDWHARRNAVWVRRTIGNGLGQPPTAGQDNYVYVRPANRGQQLAQNVTVAVYVAAGANVPPWPDAAWVALAVNPGDDVADVPPDHGTALFGPFTWSTPVQGPHAIFVTATCSSDPATTDPATGWPCATNPVPAALDTRVSCDNNLGLRVVVVQ